MSHQNNIQKFILKIMPYFKGSWLIYLSLFKLLPHKFRLYELSDSNIILDLADPPQFSIVKMRKGNVEPANTGFIRQHLNKGDIFIDIGANWGYFTCLSSKIVGEDALVVSIEPLRNTFTVLLETISRNRLTNVIPLNAAISNQAARWVSFEKPFYRQSTSAYLKERKK